ncbi:MAG: nucleoside hydrolase [Solobacterium sp.]|nr:nucleoside hydrolase [Solobacterium sp.]
MSDAVKVILDCDTGDDDAVAIMTAVLSEKIDLLGVCTVQGNKGIEYTTENTLRVIEALNADVPVFQGCPGPIASRLLYSRHGSFSGMTGVKEDVKNEKGEVISYHTDYLPLPKATIKKQEKHAVFWLVETLLASEGDICVVPTGPMTNLAMALRLEPAIAKKIKEVVFMGGGVNVFNSTGASEFNIWNDPEAAEIVLQAGIPITMVPLDATHQANFDLEDCRRLREIGTVAANAVADIMDTRIEAYDLYQPQATLHTAPLHDALALSYLIDREVLQDLHFWRVDVDISGGFADGATLCDTRAFTDLPRNCTVALGANNERFHSIIFGLLERQKRELEAA